MTATNIGRSAFMSRTRGWDAVIGRGAGVDLTLSALAGIVALLPWMSTFDGMRHLVVGGAAVVAGVAAASSGTVPGRAWRPAAIVAFLYVLIAGALVAGSVVPPWTSLGEGARLAVTGWKSLLTTVPPVDSSGPLVVLPLLLGLVAGCAGALIARRNTGPWLPVTPAVGVAILTILTGTREGWHPIVSGVGLAACATSWASLRRRRRLRVVGTGAGVWTQVAVAAALLLTSGAGSWMVAPHLPGADRPRFVARDLVEAPFDVDQYPSPLLGFRKYGESMRLLHDASLLRVSGLPAGSRLRLSVLDFYTGSVWSAGSGVEGSGAVFQRVGRTIRAGTEAHGRDTTAVVTVQPAFASQQELSPWVPGVGPWSRITFSGPRATDLRDTLRYNTQTGQGLVTARLQGGDVVSVTGAAVPEIDITKAGFRPATTPLLDPDTTAFVDPIASAWLDADPARPPLAALAIRLRDKVRAFTDGGLDAKQGYLPGHSEWRIRRFLEAKLDQPDSYGSDEQFAAAYALLANAVGVPARVVLGAVVPSGGDVTGKDIRAWVEVEAESGQWFAVPNSAFESGPSQVAVGDPEETTSVTDPVLVPPAAGAPAPGSVAALTDGDPGANRPGGGAGGGPGGDPGSGRVPAWVATTVSYAAVPTGALAAAALTAGSARGIRRRRRRTVGSASRRIAAGWRDLTDQARDLGVTVPVGATRMEQAAIVGHHGLASLADRAVFGAHDAGDAQIEAYWAQLRTARKAVRRAVPWRRRLLAPWSARSFFVRDPVVSEPTPRRARPLRALFTRGAPASS